MNRTSKVATIIIGAVFAIGGVVSLLVSGIGTWGGKEIADAGVFTVGVFLLGYMIGIIENTKW